MKRLSAVLVGITCFFALGGCGPGDIAMSPGEAAPYAGTWRSEWLSGSAFWEISLDSDGEVSRMVHVLGMELVPAKGEFYQEGLEESSEYVALGPCEANYDPGTRELNVSLVVDYFHVVIPIGEIEGTCEDIFKGHISADGKTWHTQWWSYSHLEGGRHIDPNSIEPVEVVFTRVER